MGGRPCLDPAALEVPEEVEVTLDVAASVADTMSMVADAGAGDDVATDVVSLESDGADDVVDDALAALEDEEVAMPMRCHRLVLLPLGPLLPMLLLLLLLLLLIPPMELRLL